MPIEVLAGRLSLPAKETAKIAQRLVQDQVINLHQRLEQKEGMFKASQRTYYYIDHAHAIDVVKWRMYKIKDKVDVRLRNVSPAVARAVGCEQTRECSTH